MISASSVKAQLRPKSNNIPRMSFAWRPFDPRALCTRSKHLLGICLKKQPKETTKSKTELTVNLKIKRQELMMNANWFDQRQIVPFWYGATSATKQIVTLAFCLLTISHNLNMLQYERPQTTHFEGSRRRICAERSLCAILKHLAIVGAAMGAKFKFCKLKFRS